MSTSIIPHPDANGRLVWEATDLRSQVEEMLDDPRFVGLALYMANVKIFWSREIDTACAGHGFIFFNPDFWDTLPEETRKTVMVHEVWHIILKHLERGKDYEPMTYNIAADHVINIAITKDGFTWQGFTPYNDTNYDGMSAEQVYNNIYDPTKPPPSNPNHVPAEQIEDMIEEAMTQNGDPGGVDAAQEASDEAIDEILCGKLPGNQQILLTQSNNRVMIMGAEYKDIFKPYLTDPLSGGQRTFMRPNRRQHGAKTNLRMKGKFPKRGHLNRLTHLVYGFDVSGSMMSHLQQCHDSIRTLKEILNPELMTVIFWDTQIVKEQTFTDKEPYGNIKVSAGGGTCLRAVYKRVAKLKPEALVLFTDMCVDIPEQPEWETIWLVPDKRNRIPDDLTYGEVYLIPE